MTTEEYVHWLRLEVANDRLTLEQALICAAAYGRDKKRPVKSKSRS